jgi:hypothetical protein
VAVTQLSPTLTATMLPSLFTAAISSMPHGRLEPVSDPEGDLRSSAAEVLPQEVGSVPESFCSSVHPDCLAKLSEEREGQCFEFESILILTAANGRTLDLAQLWGPPKSENKTNQDSNGNKMNNKELKI